MKNVCQMMCFVNGGVDFRGRGGDGRGTLRPLYALGGLSCARFARSRECLIRVGAIIVCHLAARAVVPDCLVGTAIYQAYIERGWFDE